MPAREARRQEAAGAALATVVVEDDVDEAGVVPEEDEGDDVSDLIEGDIEGDEET